MIQFQESEKMLHLLVQEIIRERKNGAGNCGSASLDG